LPIEITIMVLGAAFLHAAWNALVKKASDRLLVLSSVALGQFIVGSFLVFFTKPPDPSSWPAIAVSCLFHYLYYFFLFHAYRFGDLSQVYPVARGVAPILVAGGAAVFGGEILPPAALFGVVLASAGIAGTSWAQRGHATFNKVAVLYAAGTGAVIAGYSVSDGIGVRLSESPFGFIAWLFFFEWPVVVFALLRRKGRLIAAWRAHWESIAGTAFSSVLAYGIVIYAANVAPLSAVSALRESSVIMAALIGTVAFGERPWQARIAAAVMVAGGIVIITTGT